LFFFFFLIFLGCLFIGVVVYLKNKKKNQKPMFKISTN